MEKLSSPHTLIPCGNCGKIRPKSKYHSWKLYYSRKGCSRYCGKKLQHNAFDQNGSRNPSWTGGKAKTSQGYVAINIFLLTKEEIELIEPMLARRGLGKSRYILEHRLVMARHLGRPLTSNELVHHRNQVKSDNRLENLQLIVVKNKSLHLGNITCPKCDFEFGLP